jgi:hypothetical protein
VIILQLFECRHNGLGRNSGIPGSLQSLELKDQLSSSYDAATKTYTVLLKDGINVATAIPVFTAGMIQWLK